MCSDKPKLLEKIQTSLALSVRLNGSVDRTQLDSIQVLAKLVTAAGDEQQVFLDLEQPSAREADSYCAAAKATVNKTSTWSAALS